MNVRLDGGKPHGKKGFKELFKNVLSFLPSNYKAILVSPTSTFSVKEFSVYSILWLYSVTFLWKRGVVVLTKNANEQEWSRILNKAGTENKARGR